MYALYAYDTYVTLPVALAMAFISTDSPIPSSKPS